MRAAVSVVAQQNQLDLNTFVFFPGLFKKAISTFRLIKCGLTVFELPPEANRMGSTNSLRHRSSPDRIYSKTPG